MSSHLFLPQTDLSSLDLASPYADYLRDWLENHEEQIVTGDISSSLCLQAAMSELLLYDRLERDWAKVFDDWLTDDHGIPIAYSKKFAENLFQFDGQWLQRTVHASHARWWIGQLTDNSNPKLFGHVDSLVQDNGWIYNPAVSATQMSTRMNTEYMMSLAMGLEILSDGFLDDYDRTRTKASSHAPTNHLSAEYFRAYGLKILGSENLVPSPHLSELACNCEVGHGYCDFSVEHKRDEYMGTKKRTERDSAVHSPLATLHALYLSDFVDSDAGHLQDRAEKMGNHLVKEPHDIPPFQIRDLIQAFGSGWSPLAVIAASSLIERVTQP